MISSLQWNKWEIVNGQSLSYPCEQGNHRLLGLLIILENQEIACT